MARIHRRVLEISLVGGLAASLALHSSGAVVMHYASALFDDEEEAREQEQVIEVRMVRGAPQPIAPPLEAPERPPAETDQPPEDAPEIVEAETPPPEPTEIEPPAPETTDVAAVDPPVEVETEAPQPDAATPPPAATEASLAAPSESAPAEAQPETPPSSELRAAPYEQAPTAPAPPELLSETQNDSSPDAEVREALPMPSLANVSPDLEAPEARDAAPSVSRDTGRPDEPETPCDLAAAADAAEGGAPLSAADPCRGAAPPNEAPAQPEFQQRDEAPTPNQPDTERQGGEEVADAAPAPVANGPATAPRPNLRPRRQVAAPAPVDPLAGLEAAVDALPAGAEGQAAPDAPWVGDPNAPDLGLRERDALRLSIMRCWRRPSRVGSAEEMIVVLDVDLNRDGSLQRAPRVVSTGPDSSTRRLAIDSAVEAVVNCAPYATLPAEKYGRWARLRLTFDLTRGGLVVN